MIQIKRNLFSYLSRKKIFKFLNFQTFFSLECQNKQNRKLNCEIKKIKKKFGKQEGKGRREEIK